jgi:hypothetical protein
MSSAPTKERSDARAYRAEAALVRILGLLAHRRWWNDNVWAAQQIAKETLLDVWTEDEA